MKKIILLVTSLLFCALLKAQTNIFPSTGAAGIGTTSPDPSSLLDVTSTSKGVLIPRMTEEQRNALVSPAEGLLIYQTNHTPGFYYYGGKAWKALSGWSLHGNSSTNPDKEFIGTTDKESLIFKVNNQKAGIIDWYNGSAITAFGYETLSSNKDAGLFNNAFGYQALYSNTTGIGNTAIGSTSLVFNTIGLINTAVGNDALWSNTTGSDNTADGCESLFNNNDGGYNTGIGVSSLYYNTSGLFNTAIGYESLYDGGNGDNITACGTGADANGDNLINSSAFGAGAPVTASNQVRIGNIAVTSIGGYTNWTNISDVRVKKNIKENVPGLAFINLLKPVTYNYDLDAADKIVWPDGRPQPKGFQEPDQLKQLDEQSKQEKEQITYTGFLAQDVETAAKSIGYDFSGEDAPKNDKDLYGLRYAEFVVPLVKAVQELSVKNDAKDSVIENLQLAVGNLQNEVDALKSAIRNQASGDSELKSAITNPQSAILYQNLPNPFNHSTVIPFHIPADCHDASIMITNTSSGEAVNVIPVSCNDDHVQINAGTLSSGNYSYSLFVNGKIMDTKQMIIQK